MEACGDFLLGETAEVGHLDHLALFAAELHDGRADDGSLFGGVEVIGGTAFVDGILGIGFVLYFVLKAEAALDGAKSVDGLVPCHGHGPCRRLSAGRVVHRGFLPNHEHDVLGHVLGVGLVVKDAEGGGVDESRVAFVEILEAGAVTEADLPDEVDVVFAVYRFHKGQASAARVRLQRKER